MPTLPGRPLPTAGRRVPATPAAAPGTPRRPPDRRHRREPVHVQHRWRSAPQLSPAGVAAASAFDPSRFVRAGSEPGRLRRSGRRLERLRWARRRLRRRLGAGLRSARRPGRAGLDDQSASGTRLVGDAGADAARRGAGRRRRPGRGHRGAGPYPPGVARPSNRLTPPRGRRPSGTAAAWLRGARFGVFLRYRGAAELRK